MKIRQNPHTHPSLAPCMTGRSTPFTESMLQVRPRSCRLSASCSVSIPAVRTSTTAIAFFAVSMTERNILIDAVFSSRGRICMIHSEITEMAGGFVFREEILYELRSDALLSPETQGDSRQYSEVARRSSLPENMKTFLKQDQSIARLSIAEEDRPAIGLYGRHEKFRPEDFMDIPDEIVQYLDNSISSIRYSGHDFILTYRNKAQKEIPFSSMTEILSSGTMETLKIFSLIIRILRSGGYLLADGIDGSTNRTILINIIELFMRERTNPHAAHIIFTTHYQELLDVLPENDLITLTTMDDNGELSVHRFPDTLDQEECQRSDLLASDFFHIGTAPNYESYRALQKRLENSIRQI